MFHKSTFIAITVFASLVLSLAVAAAPMSWNAADSQCKTKLGAGCCAVAGDDGYPKVTGGSLHCTCSTAARKLGARLTIADRKQLAKDTANIKMTPVPEALLQPTKK